MSVAVASEITGPTFFLDRKRLRALAGERRESYCADSGAGRPSMSGRVVVHLTKPR